MQAGVHSKLEQKLTEWKSAIAGWSVQRPISASLASSGAIATLVRALPLDAVADPKLREIRQDYLDYDNRYDNDGRIYRLVPDLKAWKSARPARLRTVASGNVQIVDASGNVSGPAYAAVLWGREQTFFGLLRPSWFKRGYIAEARRRSLFSNRYSAFFGADGLLERIPVGVICVKKPVYMIEVKSRVMPEVAQRQALQFKSSDRELQLPEQARVRLDGRFWKVELPNEGPQLTAIVSERIR